MNTQINLTKGPAWPQCATYATCKTCQTAKSVIMLATTTSQAVSTETGMPESSSSQLVFGVRGGNSDASETE